MSGEAEELKRKNLGNAYLEVTRNEVNSIISDSERMHRQSNWSGNAKDDCPFSVLMGISNARNGELNKTFGGIERSLRCGDHYWFWCAIPDCPKSSQPADRMEAETRR